jgi:hypothetical protein
MVKRFFLYTYASKTQEFNYKMNVIHVNLEVNMGMNVNIYLHYGRMIFFIHPMYGWKINWIYMFLIYRTSIKIVDEFFILSLNYYQWNSIPPPNFN